MSKQINHLPPLIQRPTTSDCETWHIYWKAVGQPWRTLPEIDEERQDKLAQCLTTVPHIEKGAYPP